MKIARKSFAIFLFSLLCFTIFPLTTCAADMPINTFEQLQTAVTNATAPTIIIVGTDITFTGPIAIMSGQDITIRSVENNHYVLAVAGNFRHFVVGTDAALTLENITLEGCGSSGTLMGGGIEISGNLMLKAGALISRCLSISGNGANDDIAIDLADAEINASPSPEDNSDTVLPSGRVLDISTLVVTWSGFALAVLTVLTGVFGFIGFRELRESGELHEKFKMHVATIEELETSSKEKLSNLTKHFEDDAQTIMQATYYYTLGSNAYRDANYHDAIKYLKKSLNFLPRSTDTLCLIGRAFTIVGKTTTSDGYFRQALEINPKCSAAYRGLAAWHRHTNPATALENAKLAAKYDPENAEVLNYLGQLLRDQNLLPDAMQAHIEANNLRRNPDTDFFLGLLYAKEDLIEKARFHIRNSIDQYENVDEFRRSKPVWKALARWAGILISDVEHAEAGQQALAQLDEVAKYVDTTRTRTVVLGHVRFLLNALKKDQSYILTSERKIADYGQTS